jgi:2-keto-4-pentenoate hydratase
MTRKAMESPPGTARMIAGRFVNARLGGGAVADFPGTIPENLAHAYAVQEAAISLWPDEIAGWKIGRIPADLERRFGQSRLAGPIFRDGVRRLTAAGAADCAVFAGGFAAIEAEFVFEMFEIAKDAPSDKTDWRIDEVEAYAARLFAGAEIASSPLATINALGPTVVVSDFGNNAGLVLGARPG